MQKTERGPLRWLAASMATGLGSGFGPIAPATWGSAAAAIVYWFLPFDGDSPWLFVLIAVTLVAGTWASHVIQSETDRDPGRVVVDEIAGMWATVAFLDKTWPWMLAAFFAFRVLDVLKPGPIRTLERLPGGFGIMADDLAAGVVGAVLLNAIRLAFFT